MGIDRQINKLRVKCPNHQISLRRSARSKQKTDQKREKQLSTCDWIGSYGDLKNHLNKCELQMVSCKYCNDAYLRMDEDQHIAICSLYPIVCVQCKQKIPRASMAHHIHKSCAMAEIQCRQGCGKTILRKNMV